MLNKIFIHFLLIFSFSSGGFLTLAVSQSHDTDNKYSVLTKMFQLVIKDMESHDERLKTLENKNTKTSKDQLQEAANGTPSTGYLPGTNQECKCKSGNGDIMTQEQVNSIEENLEQIKDYLIHMWKGIAAEKSMRAENTNTIGNFVDHYNESFNKLHQTLDHHGNNVENFFNDLDTNLKAYGDKINSHTDKVIRNFTKKNKEELKVLEEVDKNGRENKEEMKTIVAALENIKKDVEQIKPVMFKLLNTNIALGKSASESSSTDSGASVATDGIKSGNWGDNSCTHTKAEMNPWWQVDLERPYFINRVVIKNRSDCCGERLHNLVISVRKEQESIEEICGHFIGPSTNGATETILCNHTVIGRYLKIQMNAESLNYLTLCEVEIFAA